MAKIIGQGNFINGSFIKEGELTIESYDPSNNFTPVFSTKTTVDHVELAVDMAKKAQKMWTKLTIEQRINSLLSLKQSFINKEEAIAQAISCEMGKIISESRIEAKSLSTRIDLMINHGLKRVQTEDLYSLRAQTRYHAQGVLAVIGPYNFPAHLVNAHVIPSILLGNTVVIKPSELCPMVAQLYAQCVMEANIPNGVVNIVHGDGGLGSALCNHKDIDGVLFTGSYNTGRKLKEDLLDQPKKILALEMGGKNFSLVMDDADIKQAVLETVMGAYLTTGQRCTATSRVLVHEKLFKPFKEAITSITKNLKPTKALNSGMFGPLATKKAQAQFLYQLSVAKEEGAQVILESSTMPEGAFVTPSIYQIEPDHPMKDYLTKELFGPNLCLEVFDHLDQAIERINQSPYGLSNSVFTFSKDTVEKIYHEVKCGVLNHNRSTNNACGQMPFGGVNMSGNQRAAGIDAVRYATYPVAITSLPYGESSANQNLKDQLTNLNNISIDTLKLRHSIESLFELYGIYADDAVDNKIAFSTYSIAQRVYDIELFYESLANIFSSQLKREHEQLILDINKLEHKKEFIQKLKDILANHMDNNKLSNLRKSRQSINTPKDMHTPRSRAMLHRLYRDNFVPQEKKSLVPDLLNSKGAFLTSIDDDPLVIIDAASQIATIGAGFNADQFLNAYDTNQLDLALIKNHDLALDNCFKDDYQQDAIKAKDALEQVLQKEAGGYVKSFSYAASGAEANEIAFDLARRNGPGGVRILAFDGSFHGRSIMSLQATHNPQKRVPFAFKGYEASFLPFPKLDDPHNQPHIPNNFLYKLSQGQIPQTNERDSLLKKELNSLRALKEEVDKGNVCCVIIEPMQCEGGDRYASNRFFNGLRALTKALKVPLIFDEVQTGFNLGRSFFWHNQFNLTDHLGKKDYPDIITLAKKAQLGICLSSWPNDRSYSPHILQLKRALLHSKSINALTALELEKICTKELMTLQHYFNDLVHNPRAVGFAFAFDMPNKDLALKILKERFNHGFMAYIAGEKTLRFRMNMAMNENNIKRLFERLFVALLSLREHSNFKQHKKITNADHTATKISFKEITKNNFTDFRASIKKIEQESYEKERQDSMESLHDWLKREDSIGIAMIYHQGDKEIFAGFAIGGPAKYADVDGAKQDPNQENTFYSADIAIDSDLQKLGLGSLLKAEQIKRVIATKKFNFISGRNRVGKTIAMEKINHSFGAYKVSTHDKQYGSDKACASYYRIAIKKHHDIKRPLDNNKAINCQNNLQEPFSKPHPHFLQSIKNDTLRHIVGSKLTLSNWATANTVRYSELLRELAPKHLRHAYFTSGRDEVLDKGLRSIKFHRQEAQIVIGFSHQWLGNITAAARSLSFDQDQTKPFSFFDWPKVSHPAVVGVKESLKELKSILSAVKHQYVLAIVVELVGEKSGLTFNNDYLQELDTLRKTTNIPLVFVDNASSLARSGVGPFLSEALAVKSNMTLWYTGSQLGHIFVDDQYFVKDPLTLISTWDGDEVSMARSYYNLLYSLKPEINHFAQNFEKQMLELKDKFDHHGLGAWHAIRFNDKLSLERALKKGMSNDIYFGRGFDNSLMICPKPDLDQDSTNKIINLLKGL